MYLKLRLRMRCWRNYKKMKIPKNVMKEIEHLKETGIPRCQKCKKDFVKDNSDYIWKPTCRCFKNKNLRLSVG